MAQAAAPGQPNFVIFKAKPLPIIPYSTFEARPEDVLLSGSSDEDSDTTRRAKRQRREDACTYYLRHGQPKLISTARLKGPFKPEHVARQRKKRTAETRSRVDPRKDLSVQVPETVAASRTQLGSRDRGVQQEERSDTTALRVASTNARSSSASPDNTPTAVRRVKSASGQVAKEKDHTRARNKDRPGRWRVKESRDYTTKSGKTTTARGHAELDEVQVDCAAPSQRRPLKTAESGVRHSEEQANPPCTTSVSPASSFLYVPTRLRRRAKEQIEKHPPIPSGAIHNAEVDSGHQLLGEQGPNEAHFQEALAASASAGESRNIHGEHKSLHKSPRSSAGQSDSEENTEPSEAQGSSSDTSSKTPQDGQIAPVSKPSTEALETERLLTESDPKVLPLNTQAAFNEALAGFQSPEEHFASIGKSRLARSSRNAAIPGIDPGDDQGYTQELAMGTQALLARAPRFSISPTKQQHRTQASKSPKEAQIGRQSGPLKTDGTPQKEAEANEDCEDSPINLMQSAPSTSKRSKLSDSRSMDIRASVKSLDTSARSFESMTRKRSSRREGSQRRSHASQTNSASQNTSSHSQGTLFGRVTKSVASRTPKTALSGAKHSSEWQDAQQDVFMRMDTIGKTSDEALDETIHDIQGFLESWTPEVNH